MEINEFHDFICKYTKDKVIETITEEFLVDCKKLGLKKIRLEMIYRSEGTETVDKFWNTYDYRTLADYVYSIADYIFYNAEELDEESLQAEYNDFKIALCILELRIKEKLAFEYDNITRIVITTGVETEGVHEFQKLTLYKTGLVKFEDFEKKEKVRLTVVKSEMERIFAKLYDCFDNIQSTSYDRENGDWEINFYNKRSELKTVYGGYGESLNYDGINLTQYMRDIIGIDDLIIFDGLEIEDRIENMELVLSDNGNISNRLTINYANNYLEHYIFYEDGTTVKHRYKGMSVRILLGNILDDVKHLDFKDNIDYTNDDAFSYKLRIKTVRNALQVYEGYYDKQGLSDNWPSFIAEIYHYMATYRDGDIFDPNCFTKRKKADDEYMVVNVAVKDVPQEYYYLCEDENVNITDIVVVPFGYDNSLRLAQIIDIDYLKKEDLPLPLEDMKYIDHIAEREDFAELEDDDYEVDHRLH